MTATPHPGRIPLEGCTIEPHERHDDWVIRYPDGSEWIVLTEMWLKHHGVPLPPRPVEITVTLTPEQRDAFCDAVKLDGGPAACARNHFIDACRASKAAKS